SSHSTFLLPTRPPLFPYTTLFRSKRAEAYLKSSGIGDTAYFGPEPEFFVFDSVKWGDDMSGCFLKVNSEEAPWSTGLDFEGGNLDRKSTRLNSSHVKNSYAVFCLK